MRFADQERIIRLEQRVQKAERELRRLRKALAEARFRADAAGVIAGCANRKREAEDKDARY